MHNVGGLNPSHSRKTVLELYLNGEYDAVAGLCLPDPAQTAGPPRLSAEAKPPPDFEASLTPSPAQDL